MAKPPTDVNFTFTPAQIDQIRPYGTVAAYPAGAPLIDEGDTAVDLIVTLSGHTDVTVQTPDGPRRIGFMEPGQFTGDIGVLTGQASLATVTMGAAGEALRIAHADLLRLLSDHSDFSDIFVRTLTARRAFARESDLGMIVIIGAAYDAQAFAIRDLLTRHGAPHRWLDAETEPLAAQMLAAKDLSTDDLPVLIVGRSRVMARPAIADVVSAFGFDRLPDDSEADVLVIGAGPAGLAASVYAGSEGLSVVTLDGAAPGGQAGASSKIENYLGFPTGVSGRDLADRAAIQAQKFGVRLTSPAAAAALEADEAGRYRLRLTDGRAIRARAVVVATGARYRRPTIKGRGDYEGRGLYYGASPMEAQLCGGSDVAVVGAGNSAGQGAMFLTQHARHVHVLYRRQDIRETMSDYLVRRLEEAPNVSLHPRAQIAGLHGNGAAARDKLRLAAIDMATPEGEVRLAIPFVFLFIGAEPCSDWLPDGVRRDEKGFVKTGAQLNADDLGAWPLERGPTQYETSWPRVYAVGDIRAGSVKRVASAVGEGSVVVSAIHRALGEG